MLDLYFCLCSRIVLRRLDILYYDSFVVNIIYSANIDIHFQTVYALLLKDRKDKLRV